MLALIAFREGEISEGRCVELTGLRRNDIRDEMKKRVGAFSPYSEASDELDAIKHAVAAAIDTLRSAMFHLRQSNLDEEGKRGTQAVESAVLNLEKRRG